MRSLIEKLARNEFSRSKDPMTAAIWFCVLKKEDFKPNYIAQRFYQIYILSNLDSEFKIITIKKDRSLTLLTD